MNHITVTNRSIVNILNVNIVEWTKLYNYMTRNHPTESFTLKRYSGSVICMSVSQAVYNKKTKPCEKADNDISENVMVVI